MSGATLAAIIVRRRGLVALVWILACALLLPKARRIESVLRVAARVDGSESAEVDEQLASRLRTMAGTNASSSVLSRCRALLHVSISLPGASWIVGATGYHTAAVPRGPAPARDLRRPAPARNLRGCSDFAVSAVSDPR